MNKSIIVDTDLCRIAQAVAPVSDRQRIMLVDAIRGVALLGILLMNIPSFAMSSYFAESFKSDPTNVNFWVNAVITVVFEGKMRALFGMMFGAGVVLFVSQKEQAGNSAAWLFYRRMMWLVLFGLIHAHLILWVGDILYLYGLCGMIVYLLRNVPPKYLVLGVPLVAAFDFTAETIFYQQIRNARIAYVEASRLKARWQVHLLRDKSRGHSKQVRFNRARPWVLSPRNAELKPPHHFMTLCTSVFENPSIVVILNT